MYSPAASAAVACPALSLISAIATLAPSRAKRKAMLRPMPVAAPVTSAILFSSRIAALPFDRASRQTLHQIFLKQEKQDRNRDGHQDGGRHDVRPVQVKLPDKRLDNPRRQRTHGRIYRQ